MTHKFGRPSVRTLKADERGEVRVERVHPNMELESVDKKERCRGFAHLIGWIISIAA